MTYEFSLMTQTQNSSSLFHLKLGYWKSVTFVCVTKGSLVPLTEFFCNASGNPYILITPNSPKVKLVPS